MNYPYTCDGMITIECQSPIKATLNKVQASELTALVAKDLYAVLKVTNQSALVFCAAAYPSEQLLQPQFPIQQHITKYASAAFQGQLNADQTLSIGANNDLMPEGLQPQPNGQNLLHLPFCLYTHDLDLAERFEAELMHKGMVSPPTYAQLSALLNTTINHANYMTYMDLVAMMHNHYEQLGLSHLWQVIEMALVNTQPKTAIQTQTHNHFFLIDHLLFTPYFSWSQFKQSFKPSDTEAYINWLMAQRLSLGAFAVHGLEIKPFKATTWPLGSDVLDGDGLGQEKVCLGAFEKQRIKGSYWIESKSHAKQITTSQVTQYTHPQAGVVAIAVHSTEQSTAIYYPITPQGLQAIEQQLQQELGQDYATMTADFTSQAQNLL